MRVVDLAALRARMESLGMAPRPERDRVAGEFRFRHLVNAFTRAAILAGKVRNWDAERIVFTHPQHLAHLPAIRLAGLDSAEAFESEVHRVYRRRLEKAQEASDLLRRLRIAAELDEPGFRVVGRLRVGGNEVSFAVREGRVLQLLSIGEASLARVEARDRRVDVRLASTSAEIEMMVEPHIARLREVLTAETKRVSPFLGEEEDEKTAPAIHVPRGKAVVPQFDYAFGELTDPGAETSEPRPVPAGAVTPSADADLIAVVCGECRGFYLVAPNPADERLLTHCPRCLAA